MNSDTERSIKDILKRGWYQQHQTLGEGGWHSLNSNTVEWSEYRILLPDNKYYIAGTSTVTARDDNAARSAFRQIFNLSEVPYEIQQVITTYRTIEENIQKEN